jgi:hypothetical protein
MATVVFLILKEGDKIPYGRSNEPQMAMRMKRSVESWIRNGATLSVANSHGDVLEINLKNVVAVEIGDEPTPPTGLRLSVEG